MPGYEAGVSLMAEGRDLPLLQDVSEVDATTAWGAIWRDVIILNADNEVVGVYNLTAHNLADAEHYDTLRTLLIEAAE